ncbi:MAG: zinc ribbon domain-containing protein [Candidatus Nitrosothermus koennekii]|nr:MAG: zinc ribbon domain-containing protein [Candidatus Nitrosothermus koennekii]
MKVFNSKAATEEYMSTHSLTYSTPDTILRKFAHWLGEIVEMDCKLDAEKCPNEDGMHPKHKVPRLMLFIEERDVPYEEKIDEEFKPTGAITSYFGAGMELKKEVKEEKATKKYCHECGMELSLTAKFCANCGAKQID